MLERLYARLEIIGYSRAIGHMQSQPFITQSMIDSLRLELDRAKVHLADIKAVHARKKREAKAERFRKTLTSELWGNNA